MIACRRERVLDALENALPIVSYCASFSMHKPFRRDDFAAEGVDYSLMTKTNTQSWNFTAHMPQNFCANTEVSGIFRCAWTWRNHYSVGFKLFNLFQGYLVVPVHDGFCPKFPNVLDKVVDERVIIVNNENFHVVSPPDICRAFIKAPALCSVSSHSLSGTESATMPAPA